MDTPSTDNAAPSSSAPSAPAPAPSAPASPAASSRPTTASAALNKASAAAPSAASATPGVTGYTPPGATPPAQPEHAGATAVTTPQPGRGNQPGSSPGSDGQGPIPLERHKAILNNVRREAEQKYGWAKDFKPDVVQRAVSIISRLDQDPRKFMADLAAELGIGANGQAEEQEPQPDLEGPDGKYKVYSSAQLAKLIEFREKRLTNSLLSDPRLQRALSFAEQGTQQQEHAEFVRQVTAVASSAIEQARQLPHFKENEKAIAEKLQAIDPEVRAQVGAVAAMYMAYNQVLAETVFPSIQRTSEQSAVESFKRKANAEAGSVHPTVGGTAAKARPRNQDELAAHMAALAAGGIATG